MKVSNSRNFIFSPSKGTVFPFYTGKTSKFAHLHSLLFYMSTRILYVQCTRLKLIRKMELPKTDVQTSSRSKLSLG